MKKGATNMSTFIKVLKISDAVNENGGWFTTPMFINMDHVTHICQSNGKYRVFFSPEAVRGSPFFDCGEIYVAQTDFLRSFLEGVEIPI